MFPTGCSPRGNLTLLAISGAPYFLDLDADNEEMTDLWQHVLILWDHPFMIPVLFQRAPPGPLARHVHASICLLMTLHLYHVPGHARSPWIEP